MKPPTLFAVDKPEGMTSAHVVSLIKQWSKAGRVGHGGTLDPRATGVLVIGIGREATKQLGGFQRETVKVYHALIRLGITSPTDDAEGPVTPVEGLRGPVPRSTVEQALGSFVGVIQQSPPSFSSVKVKGQRAYELARRDRPVILPPRPARIDVIKLLRYEWPEVEVQVTSGSGVYLRAIARDLGIQLHTGGVLWWLNRLAVGSFTLEGAASLDAVRGWWEH